MFTVVVSQNGPDVTLLVATIQKLGFDATQRTGSAPSTPEPATAATVDDDPVEAAFGRARKTSKRIVVDFYAAWCVPCRMMEKTTYKDERVIAALDDFVFVKVDTDEHPEVAQRFGVEGLPDIRIFEVDGTERARFLDFQSADALLEILQEHQTAREPVLD